MSTSIDNPIWHRTFGALVEAIDKPNFWNVLIRYLGDVASFDNWVVLGFHMSERPDVYAESPTTDGGEDELFQDYLRGFYLLDPFYLQCMDSPRAGLVRLDDVAPDHFESEDYYQRYFRLNIVKDEVQFNLPLDNGTVLILSLGGAHRFNADEMTALNTITPWILGLMRQRAKWYERAAAGYPTAAAADAGAGDGFLDIPAAQIPEGLTARELQIVHLLLSGFSSKAIAQKLGISPETVKAHRRHIYTKFGVKSHPELFAILLKARGRSGRAPSDEADPAWDAAHAATAGSAITVTGPA